MCENAIAGTHVRDVQVDVDIRATRKRFARLKDKNLDDDVNRIIKLNCTTGIGESGCAVRNVILVDKDIRDRRARLTWRFVSTSGK